MTTQQITALQKQLATQQRMAEYFESRKMRVNARKARAVVQQITNFLTLVGVEASTVNVEAN